MTHTDALAHTIS